MKRSLFQRLAVLAVATFALDGASVLIKINCGYSRAQCSRIRTNAAGDIECGCVASCATACPNPSVHANRGLVWAGCSQAITGQVKGGSQTWRTSTVTAVFAQAAAWGGNLGGTMANPTVFSKQINDCYDGLVRNDTLIDLRDGC
jgi:hypothetical protein